MSIEWKVNLPFARLKEEMAAKIDPALLVAMHYIHTTVDPITPIESGNLRGEADVGLGAKNADVSGPHIAHLYYPGPYALYQENGVFYRHGVTGPPLNYSIPGEAFYLLRPMVQESGAALNVFKKELGL